MRKWIVLSSVLLGIGVSAVIVSLPSSSQKSSPVAASEPTPATPASSSHSMARSSASLPPSLSSELDKLWADMQDAPDEGAFQQAMNKAYFELAGKLRTDPVLLKKVETMLATADVDKPLTRVAVGALAGAGTPAAQSAMARLVDVRTKDRSFLDLLVPSMGFAEHPSVELESSLRRLAANDERAAVRDMANLAIGTAAANLRTEDPARAHAIVDSFGTKLARATSPNETRTYLEVLANTGSEDAGKILSRYLDDDRRDVRAHAAEAMRLVPTKDAEEKLTTLMRSDDDETVRAGAAWALSYRQPSPELTRLEADALAVEKDATVAKRLVDNLWNQREHGDAARVVEAIEAAAKSHPVAAVREEAQSYLAQLEKKPG